MNNNNNNKKKTREITGYLYLLERSSKYRLDTFVLFFF